MVAQDVLHHHHVEENITALERYDGAARLRSAVVVTGLDRGVLTANRAAAQLFGRPLNDLPGTASNDLVMRSAGGVSAKRPATFRGAPEAHMCCSSSTSYVRPHRLHSTFESPVRNG
ncbi:MAG TPA: PAS domain-containing protein [Gemmatimonadales bacterium]